MWTKAAKISDFEEGKGIVVSIGGRDIALFKSAGAFYAINNVCPHRGGPLGEGFVEGAEVTCPWHAWAFDLKTGECSTLPGERQPTYPTKIQNSELFIDV